MILSQNQTIKKKKKTLTAIVQGVKLGAKQLNILHHFDVFFYVERQP
jgi:hypothetical protein